MNGNSSGNGASPAAEAPPTHLAARADFSLGGATIRPSVRVIEGRQGRVVAEPRVMQVLLAFVDARTAVLTREELVRTCWSGAIVGDDAVNRAVAEIRRIARETGAGFGVETIPRVGYRLTTPSDTAPPAAPATPSVTDSAAPAPRRKFLGLALAGSLAATTGVWAFYPRRSPRFDAMMDQGRQALRLAQPGAERLAAGAFQEAVKIRPDNATAWGLLALSQRYLADISKPPESASVRLAAEEALRRALQLNSDEPNALLARMLMQRQILNWFDMEKEIQRILALDPGNAPAFDLLVAMLQAAGYTQDSMKLNEQAIALDALRPTPQYRRALKLWILGKPDEADQQSAYCLESWPMVSTVRNARLIVCAFTGRTAAARQLLEDPVTAESFLSAPGIHMWKTGLAALESRSTAGIRAAREVCLATAPSGPGPSVQAVLLLSALREVDAAYQVIEGLILHRGLLVTRGREAHLTEFERDLTWRTTQWLYTPATEPLRKDARFTVLADIIGLSKYWMSRGVLPDELRPPA